MQPRHPAGPAPALGNKDFPCWDMAWGQTPPAAAGADGMAGTAASRHANPMAIASSAGFPLHASPVGITSTPALCQHLWLPDAWSRVTPPWAPSFCDPFFTSGHCPGHLVSTDRTGRGLSVPTHMHLSEQLMGRDTVRMGCLCSLVNCTGITSQRPL